ncbi:MAG TPA: glycerol kinase GlpK [Anaerolineales bacterium]|nr:glycerol kinase GlpK [Anaerolineales bacterium]
MPDFVLAVDQGTTSSRSILFDASGSAVAIAQKELPQIYPRPGWVEHDPESIWSTQLETMWSVLQQARVRAEDLAAIGITNQRETTVVWDRQTGQPVYNASVWQCRRTAEACEVLRQEGFDQVIREATGLVTDAYFSGTKVAWILDNVPGARARAERGELAFGTIDAFLLWRLTGGRIHATDVSNASRTLLFDIRRLEWSLPILDHLRIPASLLPQVHASSLVLGDCDPQWLGAPVPLAGVAGDQQAALFGQACYDPGMAKNTYGTGCFLLLNTGSQAVPSSEGLLTTVGWQLGHERPVYCLEGSVFIAGAAVQWLRDGLQLIRESAEVEALAGSVADTGDVFFVPAFVGLGAPYWDAFARGTIVGITRGTTSAHLARASLEAIAFQTRDVMEAMRADANLQLQTLRVDGGAARNDLLLQLQADVLGLPVERPVQSETTALGAAFLAGLAAGVWASPDELRRRWRRDRAFEPRMSEDERHHRYQRWKEAVARSREWARPGA